MNDDRPPWDWNIAIFCRNERLYIVDCIRAVADALGQHAAVVTIIVNGSTDDSAALAQQAAQRYGITCKIYTVDYGDKANAINQFFYKIREDARLYFFVDGYTKISRQAFQAMDDCLSYRADVVAATGIAANGRTMRLATPATLARGGQLHGQLHGLRRDFIDRLVARQICLPIGLYCGDGLIGSMAMHELDPLHIQWKPARIAGVQDAVYQIPTLSPYRFRDVRRQLHRKIRQMRGRLENAAIRSIVYDAGYEGLPEYADTMIQSFLTKHTIPPVSLFDRPFMALAKRRSATTPRPDSAHLIPRQVFPFEAGSATPSRGVLSDAARPATLVVLGIGAGMSKDSRP